MSATATSPPLLITGAQVAGRLADVRVRAGVVTEVARSLSRRPHEEVVEAAGGALLPGLHDHHIHLLALAAANRSTPVGPPSVRSREAFAGTLVEAARHTLPGQWIRAVGYHESVAGPLDRDALDRIAADRPIRVQHRSGGLWILNSAALHAAGLDSVHDPDVERDSNGRLTGRLWRWDTALREAVADEPRDLSADLAAVSGVLAPLGITGVTDATPDLDTATLSALCTAASNGTFVQRLMLLGPPLGRPLPPGITAGPAKLLLHDHDLPTLEELTRRITAAHQAGRAVAVHCVTRESLLLTLNGLADAGPLAGDRIEHAAVVPPEIQPALRRLGVRVVTQPAFITDRGDEYLTDVDPEDRPLLYPFRSLLDAGVPVAASSDAPFGELDPWRIVRAANARRTAEGQPLATEERVPTATALAGYLSDPNDPGGPPRRNKPGAAADFCLLAEPLEATLRDPSADRVMLVMRAGRTLWRRG